jgi:hypothetical protein
MELLNKKYVHAEEIVDLYQAWKIPISHERISVQW